jgi:predicted RecA/RadA family phage recombinase
MQNYKRAGRCIDYTAAADVPGGGVVVFPGLVAVASTDIPAGATGACEVEGVYVLPKAAGAIAQGARLFWNGTAVTGTKPSTGAGYVGIAWAAAGSGDPTVEARINFGAVPVPDPAD